MNGARFEEQQGFHWIAYAVMLILFAGTVSVTVAALHVSGGTNALRHAWWFSPLPILTFAVVFNVFCMRTWVFDDRLVVQFGYLFPLYRKSIPLTQIQQVRIVEYRPMRDAGGWGIRFGRFEGAACRFLNSLGKRGILVETQQLRVIVGSQKPEHLHAVLSERLQA